MQTGSRHQNAVSSTQRIIDDLTDLSVSRQRKYQIRKMREGFCIICGTEKRYKETLFCLEHNFKRGIREPGHNKTKQKKWLDPSAPIQ